jgi:hypothetical protein
MERGTYAYVREGRKYEGGLFGGELEEAVQGNPQAVEYARAYKTGKVTGFVLTLLGAAAAIGGIVLFATQATQTPSTQDVPPTGLFIAGGGLLVELAGSIVMLNAEPHMTDAINAYNDGLLSAPPPRPPEHAPPTTTAPTEPGRIDPPGEPQSPARSSGEVPRQAGTAAP